VSARFHNFPGKWVCWERVKSEVQCMRKLCPNEDATCQAIGCVPRVLSSFCATRIAHGSVEWVVRKHLWLCFRYSMLEDGSLHIHAAHVMDTGRYVCMATNAAGTERKRTDLQVLGKSFGFREIHICVCVFTSLKSSYIIFLVLPDPFLSLAPF